MSLRSWALRTFTDSRTGRRVARAWARERAGQERALVREATAAWKNGRREDAVRLLREAVLVNGGTARTWFRYAGRLAKLGRADAAWEAIQASLDRDPTQLDALELFSELEYRTHRRTTLSKQAVATLAASLGERPDLHREALAFLIPAGVEAGLDPIRVGPDAVARGVVLLHDAERAGGREEFDRAREQLRRTLAVPEWREAEVRYALARGRAKGAATVLAELPADAVPADAVRRSIRRVLRRDDPTAALWLLAVYLRVRPGDRWAAAQETKLRRRPKAPDLSVLTERRIKGFPFSPHAERPPYEPNRRTSLYLLHNSLPYASAGYATRTHGLLSSMAEHGWDVQGVTRPPYPLDMVKHLTPADVPARDVIGGVTYHRIVAGAESLRSRPLVPFIREYARRVQQLAQEQRPALIHAASNHWNGLTAVESARLLGVPSVYEVRGLWEVTRMSREPEWSESDSYRFTVQMETEAARNATHVFAITAALRDELVRRGVEPDRVTLLPNGVDTGRFVPRTRDEDLATQLGLSGKTVVGYLGSVVDYEGLELLAQAAAYLRRRREDDDFRVLIVGDGAALPDLRHSVAVTGVEDLFVFTGRVPHHEVERYHSLVDIAPLPRRSLPVCEMVSPLKPFESMAMCQVVVASDVAALAEIVEDGVTGLLHAKDDAHDLARQIERLLDDPLLLKRLAEQSREWVVRERDWRSISRIVEDVYGQLVETSGVR